MSASDSSHAVPSAGRARERMVAAAPGASRTAQARRLGAEVAATAGGVDDVVTEILAVAIEWWKANPRSTDGGQVRDDAERLLREVAAVTRVALQSYHHHALDQARSDSDRSDFVNDLLSGRADPSRLAGRAQRYGIRLAGDHTVTVVRSALLDAAAVHQIDTALAARFGAGNTLTTLHEGQLVCISTGGLRGLPAELAHLLLGRLGAGGWQVGVGRPHRGAAGIAASLDEARNVLDFAGRLGFTSPVQHAADLLVFPVLLRDREAIIDLVETVLGPLQLARGGVEPYLRTLSALFDNQGNYTAAARALHLSVRAVTYRLDRIQALTGFHPGEPTQRFTLQAAVLGARLLNWPESTQRVDNGTAQTSE